MTQADLPPRQLVTSSAFERDAKRLRKRGMDMARLFEVVEILRMRRPIPPRLHDHPLRGDWEGFRDCHIEPDWILIYRADDEAVYLTRTGTHADLFR